MKCKVVALKTYLDLPNFSLSTSSLIIYCIQHLIHNCKMKTNNTSQEVKVQRSVAKLHAFSSEQLVNMLFYECHWTGYL